MKEVPVCKILGQEQSSWEGTEGESLLDGPGVSSWQGSQILWTFMTQEVLEIEDTHVHEQGIGHVPERGKRSIGQIKK